MSKIHKVRHYFFMAVGLLIIYWGVRDVNTAKTGVELIRGFFWIIIGGLNIWTAK